MDGLSCLAWHELQSVMICGKWTKTCKRIDTTELRDLVLAHRLYTYTVARGVIDTHSVLTLNSQPCPFTRDVGGPVSVSPGRPKVTANRVSHSGFPRGKKETRGRRRKAIQLLFSVCCSHHGRHLLFCTCYYVEIWLFSHLAISVLLLWKIKSGKQLKRRSQFIREETEELYSPS